MNSMWHQLSDSTRASSHQADNSIISPPPSPITLSTTGQHWRGLSRVFYEEVWLLDWLFLWPDVSPINFKTNQASLQNWSFCSQSVTSQSVASFMILLLTPRNVSKPTLKRLNEILTSVQRIRWTASTTGAKRADFPPPNKKKIHISSFCLFCLSYHTTAVDSDTVSTRCLLRKNRTFSIQSYHCYLSWVKSSTACVHSAGMRRVFILVHRCVDSVVGEPGGRHVGGGAAHVYTEMAEGFVNVKRGHRSCVWCSREPFVQSVTQRGAKKHSDLLHITSSNSKSEVNSLEKLFWVETKTKTDRKGSCFF